MALMPSSGFRYIDQCSSKLDRQFVKYLDLDSFWTIHEILDGNSRNAFERDNNFADVDGVSRVN